MRKLFFSAIALFAGFLTGFAQTDKGYSLVVEHQGGSTQFLLSAQPVIRYSGDDMIITAPDGKFSYLRSDVSRIYFTQETNSAATINADMQVSLSGDKLSLRGIENSGDITVYDLTGRRVNVSLTSNDGEVTVDFSQAPKATYIISIPNHNSLKITLK